MSENKTLTLGSLFDGSGSFPFGGILAGIEPKWNSEIEPFPVLVTHKRLPQVTEEDLRCIAAFAATAASLSTEAPGGIPSIPEKDAVQKAM